MKGISAGKKSGFRDFSGTMTDISFLLIIFFLITAAFVTDRGLFMTLPDLDAGPKELSSDQVVVIGIAKDTFTVDGVGASEAMLQDALKRTIEKKRPEAVILEVEKGVPYARVLATLESAKAAGGDTFSINMGADSIPVEIKENTP